MNLVIEKMFIGFEWFMKTVKLNLIWIFFSIIGLGIFTIFPTTSATLAVTNEWIKGNFNTSIRKVFIPAFKKNFWKSQILGYSMALFLLVLYVDFKLILTLNNSVKMNIMLVFLIAILVVFILFTLYAFPILIHLNKNLKETLKLSILNSLSFLNWTVLTVLGLIVIGVVTFKMPILLLFLSVSASLFFVNFMYKIIFREIIKANELEIK